jgi:hypothetical protein
MLGTVTDRFCDGWIQLRRHKEKMSAFWSMAERETGSSDPHSETLLTVILLNVSSNANFTYSQIRICDSIRIKLCIYVYIKNARTYAQCFLITRITVARREIFPGHRLTSFFLFTNISSSMQEITNLRLINERSDYLKRTLTEPFMAPWNRHLI